MGKLLISILVFCLVSFIFGIAFNIYRNKFQSPRLNSYLIILIISLIGKLQHWVFYRNKWWEIIFISIGLWILFIAIMIFSGFVKVDDI